MAMTKKFKVSFDVTAVMPTDVQEDFEAQLIDFCKQVGKGELEPNGSQKEMIVQFLTYGLEGAMSFLVRQGLREAIKDLQRDCTRELPFKFSPAAVREVF